MRGKKMSGGMGEVKNRWIVSTLRKTKKGEAEDGGQRGSEEAQEVMKDFFFSHSCKV